MAAGRVGLVLAAAASTVAFTGAATAQVDGARSVLSAPAAPYAVSSTGNDHR